MVTLFEEMDSVFIEYLGIMGHVIYKKKKLGQTFLLPSLLRQ